MPSGTVLQNARHTLVVCLYPALKETGAHVMRNVSSLYVQFSEGLWLGKAEYLCSGKELVFSEPSEMKEQGHMLRKMCMELASVQGPEVPVDRCFRIALKIS